LTNADKALRHARTRRDHGDLRVPEKFLRYLDIEVNDALEMAEQTEV
jgi:hypothetical protein